MQISIELTLGLILLGALFAGVATWILVRNRNELGQQQAALGLAAQLASAEQKQQFAAREADRLREEAALAESEGKRLTQELDQLREQRTHFQTHAERIPSLVSQWQAAQEEVRQSSKKLIELNHSDGQKTREIEDLRNRLTECDIALQQASNERDVSRNEARQQGERLADLSSQNTGLRKTIDELRSNLLESNTKQEAVSAEARQQAAHIAELTTTLEAERGQAVEKLTLLNEAKDQLKIQFENLANQILEEKGQRFAKQNQENLGLLLNPLNEKIKTFQEQVAQTYDKDSKERLTLKNEIERLAALNTQIGEDAVNLTQALKGSNKAQGIWGEMVLERVLESSGLTKGREYQVQEHHASDEGSRQHPDAVIYLPEDKQLVVDAKMSLLAYERYCSAENDGDRASAQKQHLASVRAHIKGLSEKNYQNIPGLKSPDFVLMFIPVEPAFMLAATAEPNLFNEAFSKNVLLVSPSTLLATLRTIANIWRQELQNQNARAIADQCAKLYDKFVGFVENIEEIGKRLEHAQASYRDAHSKLSTGRGNLIGQLEKIKKLGVRPGKRLLVSFQPDTEDESDAAYEAIAQA